MLLLTRIQEVKEKVNLLEKEVMEGGYSWDNIRNTIKIVLPIINEEAIEKFKASLDAKPVEAVERKDYGRRKLPDFFPSTLDMTAPVIAYLKTCNGMSASKKDIYQAIRNNYSKEAQAVPHLVKGKTTQMSELEYRLEWACTLLTKNKKAIGRNQDPKLPKKHIKLISKTNFTKEEIEYLKKNKNSLVGYKPSVK